jgi:hypothetical protein
MLPQSPAKRFNDDPRDDVPGPGSYQIGPPLSGAPKWTRRLRVVPLKKRRVEMVVVQNWEDARFEV